MHTVFMASSKGLKGVFHDSSRGVCDFRSSMMCNTGVTCICLCNLGFTYRSISVFFVISIFAEFLGKIEHKVTDRDCTIYVWCIFSFLPLSSQLMKHKSCCYDLNFAAFELTLQIV